MGTVREAAYLGQEALAPVLDVALALAGLRKPYAACSEDGRGNL